MRRLWVWAGDDRNQHRTLMWAWLTVGAYLNFGPPQLQSSVPWVSFMSLYAIVVSHWSGIEGAKAQEAAA